ncbi:helix-turn-helix domain-containing protein [Anaerocolumna sp. AGMB13025]|uniref:PucR family transcriptional regulator n=1 Tax=Anaerocolumna sp. AGMB13025 TaxID=3039116 RepID=UPI00241EE4D1|nr:helix-turn-helix domain-containing protein [Anaerocolumna sp. AGMB13025]WFR55861.1 helix-turn-helix domain-containing protein [Anaerocolumna sp. AGMB13025]
MNITEIGSWLKEKYDITFFFHAECFVIQVICTENIFCEQSELQKAIYVMYCDDIPAKGLPENGNYIIIGTGITNKISGSNYITINEHIDKHILCKELNIYIAQKAETHYRLARLNQILLSDNFMEHLMDYLFEQFQNPITYVDYSHHVISHRQHESMGIDLWDNTLKYGYYDPNMIEDTFQHYVDIVIRSQPPFHTKEYGYDYYVWTIKNDTALYGFFTLITTRQLMTPDDLTIISTAADLVALKLQSINDISGKGDYRDVLNDLLSGIIKTEQDLTFRMMTRIWKKSEYCQILLIDLHGKGEKNVQYVKNGIDTISRKIKHITFDEYEVILLEKFLFVNDDLKKIYDYITQYSLISGLSDTFNSLIDIKLYYEQAKKAILFGGQFGDNSDIIFKYSDYRFYDFMVNCADSLECKKYYHPVTADLELYDVEHKTDFFNTLLTYLECGRSIQKTCKKMFLHKNTVNYRIQRIKELFNIDYEDGQTVLFIYLSLMLSSINKIKS